MQRQPEEQLSEQCKVCGNEADRYVYYGGKSCASCRGFFRRSVVQFSRLGP